MNEYFSSDESMGIVERPDNRIEERTSDTSCLEAEETPSMQGLWRSPGNSLYWCDGKDFVCISVGLARFVGWIGKVAVRVIHFSNGSGTALQAFRDNTSGGYCYWERIQIELHGNTLTKHFPPGIARSLLVYGYKERYERATVNGDRM